MVLTPEGECDRNSDDTSDVPRGSIAFWGEVENNVDRQGDEEEGELAQPNHELPVRRTRRESRREEGYLPRKAALLDGSRRAAPFSWNGLKRRRVRFDPHLVRTTARCARIFRMNLTA